MRISDWSSDVCSSDLYIKQTKIFRSAAIRGVRLHIDALHPPAIYEIVDVCAAPGGADGVVHVRLRQSMSPGQRLIDINLRSEEHTSELQSLMRISYAVFCLNKKTQTKYNN